METNLFWTFPTYLLLISFKMTTFLLLLSSNIGKVAELWTLDYKYCEHHQASVSPSFAALSCPVLTCTVLLRWRRWRVSRHGASIQQDN